MIMIDILIVIVNETSFQAPRALRARSYGDKFVLIDRVRSIDRLIYQ